jgi:hypothetical protein
MKGLSKRTVCMRHTGFGVARISKPLMLIIRVQLAACDPSITVLCDNSTPHIGMRDRSLLIGDLAGAAFTA